MKTNNAHRLALAAIARSLLPSRPWLTAEDHAAAARYYRAACQSEDFRAYEAALDRAGDSARVAICAGDLAAYDLAAGEVEALLARRRAACPA